MSSSQAVAASLMGPPPPDLLSDRPFFDLHPDQKAQPSPAKDIVTSLDVAMISPPAHQRQPSTPTTTTMANVPSPILETFKHEPDQQRQTAASSLLAQLLASKPSEAAESSNDSSIQHLPSTPVRSVAPTPEVKYEEAASAIELANDSEWKNGGVATAIQHDGSLDGFGNVNAIEGEPVDIVLPDAPTEIDSQTKAALLESIDNMDSKPTDLNQNFSNLPAISTPVNPRVALDQTDLLTSAYFASAMNGSGGGPTPRMVGYPELPQTDSKRREGSESVAGSEPRIQAFAKLEFDDGHFYVNTYSFILGRDVRAARVAYQRDFQLKQNRAKGSSGGKLTRTPSRVKREGSGILGSVISDRGGIMGFDPDVPQNCPPQMSWKSSNSSSDQIPRPMLHISHLEQHTPGLESTELTDYNALAMQSLQGHEPKRVDTLSLLPSPEACPTIPIHPPVPVNGASSHRAISRKHVKITYNFNKNVFEMEVMGRNGAFMGADWLAPGQVRSLHSGDYIQIGGVRVRFLLPDVPIGATGADILSSLSDIDEEIQNQPEEEPQESDAAKVNASIEDSEQSDDDGASTKASTSQKISSEPGQNSNSKRRGPGRPPKDGIMSKRERAEIAREQKMAAKREANGGISPSPPGRVKPAKPAKESVPEETPSIKTEKRKYTKRKKPDSGPGEPVLPSIEGGTAVNISVPQSEPVRATPVKKRKPSKSPSPDYPPESFYTAKDLAKPPYNYAVLIFDALSDSPTPMTLKQIYRALKLKYPYFRFKCETEGWTSSVRHNLNGNSHLFTHAERDGKGWSWKLTHGASVDKEKKRRPSPPPPPDVSGLKTNQRFLPPNTVAPPYMGTPPHITPRQHPFAAPVNTPFPQAQHPPIPKPPLPGLPPQLQRKLPASFGALLPTLYRSPYVQAPSQQHIPPPQQRLYQQPIQPHPPQTQTHQQHAPNRQPPQLQVQPPPQHLRSFPQPPQPPQPQQQQQNQHPLQPPPLQNQFKFHNQTLSPASHQTPHHSPQPPPNPMPSQPLLHPQPHPHPQTHPQTHPHPPHQPHPHPQPHPQPSPAHTRVPQSNQPPNGLPPSSTPKPQPSPAVATPAPPNASGPPSMPQPTPPAIPPAAPHHSQLPHPASGTMDPAFRNRANQAIDNFEAVLMEDYEDQEYIRKVLRSARDRVLNGAKQSSFPGGEPKDESVIIDALRGIIGSLTNQNQQAIG
ncbi:hypothetical protein FQN57_004319 [Myotisia sp. PD_48]|nr:hypothetical protein FQN57_004319 [Myotisia sp. PD_48]